MTNFIMPTADFQTSKLLEKFGWHQVYDNSTKAPDVVVLVGGVDVNPTLYFEERGPATDRPDMARDYKDYCAIIAARLVGIPQLGICRGHQLLHVAFSGTLTQHIDGHAGPMHKLVDKDGNPLEGFEDMVVTSSHHQCVPKDEIDQYDYVALSPDGVPEVIFSEAAGFLGVQFHPEYQIASPSCVGYFDWLLSNKLAGVL
jgi:putative glutamine amidotransferase